MRYSYDCELNFIIPHFRVVENSVVGIDYYDFKRYLYNDFKVLGLNYYHVLPIKEVIDGVEYDADLVVIHCAECIEQLIIHAFQDACCKYREELDIDFFTYTQNGVLISLEIGGDNDEILRDS